MERGGASRLLYGRDGRLRAAWRLLLFLLAAFAAWATASGAAVALLGPDTGLDAGFTRSAWVTLAALAGAHVMMVRWIDRRPWRDVGLGRDDARAATLARGALLGATAIGLPSLLLLAAGLLRAEPAPAAGGLVASWLGTSGRMLAFLAPAALFEELAVRGYPFLVLRESLGALPALVLTSVVFGLLHLGNPGVTAGAVALVTLAGIFLGGVLLATGSLWAAWTAHLAWNWTLGALLHASVSGLPFATPGYRVVDAGPDWLTGGAWGPEGGAGAGLGMLAALALLLAGRARALRAHASDRTHLLTARPDGRGGS